MPFAATWMDLIIFSEVSQTETYFGYLLVFLCVCVCGSEMISDNHAM